MSLRGRVGGRKVELGHLPHPTAFPREDKESVCDFAAERVP